jgi:hypothetical protein
MKNNLLKFYIVATYLCSTAILFAQDPGIDDGTGTMEGTSGDNTGTPIGDYIWVLALVVVVYAFWKISAMQNARIKELENKGF